MKQLKYSAEEARNDAKSFLASLDHTIDMVDELIHDSAAKGHISCDATSYVPEDQRNEIMKQLKTLGYNVETQRNKFFIFW